MNESAAKICATPVAAVVGALLLVAACSSGGTAGGPSPAGSIAGPTQTPGATGASSPGQVGTPDAGAGGIDACALLTKAEVETAIGTNVLEPKELDNPPAYECDYNNPETPVFSLASVDVIVSDNADQAKGMFDQIHENSADEAISGLGDAAYWSVAFGLDVLVGRYVMGVDVDPQIADQENVEKALAAKAITRLP